MADNNVKKFLESGGSQVIKPTKENVKKLLELGGSKVYSPSKSDYQRFPSGGSSRANTDSPPPASPSQPQQIQEPEAPQSSSPQNNSGTTTNNNQPSPAKNINQSRGLSASNINPLASDNPHYGETPKYYKQSIWQSTKQFIKRPFSSAPFKYSEKKLQDIQTSIPKDYGTKTTEQKFQTMGDIQQGIETKRNLSIAQEENRFKAQLQNYAENRRNAYQKELQNYVHENKGQITQQDVEVRAATYNNLLQRDISGQANQINQSFTERADQIYAQNPDIKNVYERTGGQRRIVEFASNLIGGTISAVTLGSTAPYMVAKGASQLSAGSKDDVYLVGKDGTIYRDMPVKEQSPLTKSGNRFLVMSALTGTIAPLYNLRAEVISDRIAGGEAAKSVTISKQIYQKGHETGVTFEQLQKTPDYIKHSTGQFPVFQKTDNSFTIGQGDIEVVSKVRDFPNEADWINLPKKSVKAFGSVDIADLQDTSILKGYSGGGKIVNPDKTITDFNYGGAYKTMPGNKKILISRGGELISEFKKTPGYIRFEDLATGYNQDVPLNIYGQKFSLQDYALSMNNPETMPGSSTTYGYQGGGATSSQEYIMNLYNKHAVGDFVNAAVKNVKTTPPTADLIKPASVSAYAGKGQYEQQTSGGMLTMKQLMKNELLRYDSVHAVTLPNKQNSVDTNRLITALNKGFKTQPVQQNNNFQLAKQNLRQNQNYIQQLYNQLTAVPPSLGLNAPGAPGLPGLDLPGLPAVPYAKKPKFGGPIKLEQLYKTPRKFKPKYTATLNSAAFNITKKITPEDLKKLQKKISSGIEFTGFETMPLLEIVESYAPKKRSSKRRKK